MPTDITTTRRIEIEAELTRIAFDDVMEIATVGWEGFTNSRSSRAAELRAELVALDATKTKEEPSQ